jgi:hypothetical protein
LMQRQRMARQRGNAQARQDGLHGKFTQFQNPNWPKELSAVAGLEPD